MNCCEACSLLRDHVDRELGREEAERIEAHLRDCPECLERVRAEQDLKRTIRSRFRPGPATPGLAASIGRKIREETERGRRPRLGRLILRAAAAVIGVAAVVTALILVSRSKSPNDPGKEPEAESSLARELVDDHIRYATSSHPFEVTTTDPDQAEDWFDNRLDVAVVLPRFREQSLALRGARLCYVVDRRVALFFYERAGERLSLFVMSESGLDLEGMTRVELAHADFRARTYKGYEVVCWKVDGLLYALVASQGKGLVELIAGAYQD
ncbi:MAG: zf-HC2 domain-containing protein [Planctomycetes bacterium]|nr:zf-HC2 domain-containing protein [Planctomycetota bacterium]